MAVVCSDCVDISMPVLDYTTWLIGRDANLDRLVTAILGLSDEVSHVMLIDDFTVVNFPALFSKLSGYPAHAPYGLALHAPSVTCQCKSRNATCAHISAVLLSRENILAYRRKNSTPQSSSFSSHSLSPTLTSVKAAAGQLEGVLHVKKCEEEGGKENVRKWIKIAVL